MFSIQLSSVHRFPSLGQSASTTQQSVTLCKETHTPFLHSLILHGFPITAQSTPSHRSTHSQSVHISLSLVQSESLAHEPSGTVNVQVLFPEQVSFVQVDPSEQ